MIMTVVVSLIILAVGVFAFFTVVEQADTVLTAGADGAGETSAVNNTSKNISNTGNSVFNIVGVVLIIGAIMTIVGLVYSYTKGF